MQYHAIPCNTMHYNAIPCNTMQYNAIPCNTMQYHSILCNTMQYLQYHAIPCIINYCWRSIPLPCWQYNGHFFPLLGIEIGKIFHVLDEIGQNSFPNLKYLWLFFDTNVRDKCDRVQWEVGSVSLRISILTSSPPADKTILADDTMMVATKVNTGAIIIQELYAVHTLLFWGVCAL